MFVLFNVSKVLDPYEKYDKKFYPVSVKDLKGLHGDMIFNSLTEIPIDCKQVVGELYSYKGQLKIKNIKPYVKENK